MSKQLLTSVIETAATYSTINRAELLAVKEITQSAFDSVVDNRLVDMSFVDATYHALSLIRLCLNDAPLSDIKEKTKDVLIIVNSLRYKLCGDNGIIRAK